MLRYASPESNFSSIASRLSWLQIVQVRGNGYHRPFAVFSGPRSIAMEGDDHRFRGAAFAAASAMSAAAPKYLFLVVDIWTRLV
jgi:hypothetical protein